MADNAIREICERMAEVQALLHDHAEWASMALHWHAPFVCEIKGKIEDRDICNFLVDLTRAREKVLPRSIGIDLMAKRSSTDKRP
jgi:hypothetical protein